MMRQNSMAGDHSGAGDAREFWGGVFDRRIVGIENAPPARQYSSIMTSNIEALDEERRVLQDEIDSFRRRCDNEDQALHTVLDALHDHRARRERAIESTIAAMHQHRNTLVPISRLPPEILSRIFVFHAQIWPWKWLEAALTSTRVCRRWRQVGLDCPGLWSHIDCRSALWMATVIERSRSVPLSLFIVKQEDMDPRKMALVANNLHRFKLLNLHIPDTNTNQFLELFSAPAPLLEHLDITDIGHVTFSFPSEFLGGSAPNLRYIKLFTHSYVPWTSGLFANLVSLYIHGHTEEEADGPEAPSLEMLLSALSKMPGLEDLVLSDCLPPPTPSTVIARVALPNLEYLRISGSLRNRTGLFGRITINPNAILRAFPTCVQVSKADVDEFFAIFPSCLFAAPSPAAYALKFDWQESFRVDAWTAQQATEDMDRHNTKILLNFDWDPEDSPGVNPLDLTWACFVALASPQLHSFRIFGNPIAGWDAEVWRKLAHVSPDLRRLALTHDIAQCMEFCQILRPPEGRGLVPTDCCLPTLSYLELLSSDNNPLSKSEGVIAPLSEVLPQFLSTRAAIGCSTPELVFMSFWMENYLEEDWSKPLTDAVPGIIVRAGDCWGSEEEVM